MARIGLTDVRGLVDPLLSYQVELIVPTIPGQGNGQRLAIQCKTNQLPGKAMDDVDVTLHGVTVKHRGRVTFTHTMDVEFLETRDMYSRTTISTWIDYANNIQTISGNYKSVYSTTAKLLVYDQTNTVVDTISLFGFFPREMKEIAMDGSNSAAVMLGVTFSYDVWSDQT